MKHGTILLITSFGKNEKSNLTTAEKRRIAVTLKTIEAQLRSRGEDH